MNSFICSRELNVNFQIATAILSSHFTSTVFHGHKNFIGCNRENAFWGDVFGSSKSLISYISVEKRYKHVSL